MDEVADVEPSVIVDEKALLELRQQMLKFARQQIRDAQLAEDAVQEALIAAYQQVEKFGRRAAFKTWVFAILKNKLIDVLRKERRHTAAEDLQHGSNLSGDELMDVLFKENGHWNPHETPQTWHEPDGGVYSEDFWRVFDACLNALPEKYSRFFMMREFLELSTQEICHNESLTVSNLNVILYRARIRLRECLEDNWYLEGVD
ncbi:sigma-70 family RNA polymerase sigma factor [Celerinatantimonas yamalensis]|uniref:Sigma-70 family RNA polymerase sigma factor n=1 Tax=Celerinatantimonas yamalensis TaxID=559956 RepID=A0ABW9G905_9GAMM